MPDQATPDWMPAGGCEPLAASRRLVVFMPTWVGDCVMATPLLRAVRRAYNDTPHHLAGYMPPHLVPLMQSAGLFDECIGGRANGLTGPLREGKRLRSGCFDAALLLPNSFRAALTARLAGIPRRIGYRRDLRAPLLSDGIGCPMPGGWKTPIPQVEYYCRLAAPLGVHPGDDTAPGLAISERETARSRSLLDAEGVDRERPLVLLNPGASKAGKRWPVQRFAALADRLHERYGMQVLVNGSPAERPLVRELAAGLRRASLVDLAARETSLATLAAICSLVRLVVTNDTGTRHIAAAAGFDGIRQGGPVPGILTLFGEVQPEWTRLDYPFETGLYDRRSADVRDISVDQAFQACEKLIERLP